MEIFKNRELAEEAKRSNPGYSVSDMIVKVDGGFAIMSAREYINWLVKQ